MNKRVLLFSRNLIYNLGGAERSIFSRIDALELSTIVLVYAEQMDQQGNIFDFVSNDEFSHYPIRGAKLQKRLFYIEYFRNKLLIERRIADCDYEELWAQNRWAPAAVLAAARAGRDSVLFLRDETSLAIFNNYYQGLRRYSKKLYMAFESPWMQLYKRDVELAVQAATRVVANSNFMAGKLFEMYGVDSIVEYPRVDVESLKVEYAKQVSALPAPNSAVVMVGDNRIKGVDIFIELAKNFPEHNFFIFGKGGVRGGPSNLTHMGWYNNSAKVYANAKVVIVPSLWEEAFGRVAFEARSLGIPVLVSNKGGLPEAVDYDLSCIAQDEKDFFVKLRAFL